MIYSDLYLLIEELVQRNQLTYTISYGFLNFMDLHRLQEPKTGKAEASPLGFSSRTNLKILW